MTNKQDVPEIKPSKFHIPWWIYLLIAIVLYFLLKYILPQLNKAAPILAIVFLVLAANALYKNDIPEKTKDEDLDKENNQ